MSALLLSRSLHLCHLGWRSQLLPSFRRSVYKLEEELISRNQARGRTGLGRAQTVRVNAIVDPWAPGAAVDSQSVASSLFAVSLFPYLGFLYHMTKSKSSPPLTLFGFYFLLAFVGATIPAGIYAKVHYGTSLSNVDWLHGSAESLLTLTNLFIVIGLRKALRDSESERKAAQVGVEETEVSQSK